MKKSLVGSIICGAMMSLAIVCPALAATASYSNILDVRDANMEFLADNKEKNFGTVENVVETMNNGYPTGWSFEIQSTESDECGILMMNGTKAVAVAIPLDEMGSSIKYEDKSKTKVGTVMIAVQYDGSSIDGVIDAAVGAISSFSGGDEIANSAFLYQMVMSWCLAEGARDSDDGRYYVGHGMNAYGTGMLAMSSMNSNEFMYILVSR